MAQFQSNLITPPASSALNNKMNPSLFKPIVPGSYKSFGTPTSIQPAQPAVVPKPVDVPQNGQNIMQNAPKNPETTPTPAPSTNNPALKSALEAHVKTLQAQLKDQQIREANPAPAPAPTPFGQALDEYDVAAKRAADTNLAIEKAKTAALHDPNYSLDTGIGRAGQIQANLGLQGANAAALAAAALNKAGLAKPAPAAYGQQVFNPVTGQYESGGQGGGQSQTIESLAADVIAKRKSPSQAESLLAGGPAVNAQLDAAIKKLDPNYNRSVYETQTSTLAGVVPMEAANTAAKGIKNTINSFIDSNPQLNQVDAAVVNSAQQWLQGKQLTDPKYQTLFNYLNEYTSTLAPILGVGGSATNLKTEIAQSFVNAQASGASIKEVLNNIESLADNKIQNLKSGAVGGGVVSGGTVPSGEGLYNF